MFETLKDALRIAPKHNLDHSLVSSCIYSGDEKLLLAERQFEQIYNHSLSLLPRKDRSPHLNGIIGQTAEAVASMILCEHDWIIIDQSTASYPGGHGVDLLVLSPAADKLYAVEVKGTFRKSRWPKLSKGKLYQMSLDWLNKKDNPIMQELDLSGSQIYGMILYIHFGKNEWKGITTADYIHGEPISSLNYSVS